MNVFAIGDVAAKSGRRALKAYLPSIVAKYHVDVVIANVDNAAHGIGITSDTFQEIIACGVDICTGGNHIFNKIEILNIIDYTNKLLRPHNYSRNTPGRGIVRFRKNNSDILVVHLAGQRHMHESADNPFMAIDDILNEYKLGKNIDFILVDFHAETTSEKVAFGHYVDGRVSFVFGTHTHVPTADLKILPNGTAYITDLGMTGDYDSVISMEKSSAIGTFISQGNMNRLKAADGDGSLCGAVVSLNDCGLAKSVQQIRIGGDNNWCTTKELC